MIKLQEGVHKLLISSPSRLVGEYQDSCVLLSHAWSDNHARFSEGPASRSAYIFVFETEEPERAPGVVIQDYSPVGPMICSYLSVLFGKRFDTHGLTESQGLFRVPNLSQYLALADHRLPHNSHKIRRSPEVSLDLGQFKSLAPLLNAGSVDKQVLQTFQSASKFYWQSLQTFESDPEVSYLHLINSGEVISNFFEFPRSELIDESLAEYFQEIEDKCNDGAKIVRAISGKMYSVRRRFVKSLLGLLDDNFYLGYETDESWKAMTKEDIKERLLAAYDLRSKYLHTGAPFGSWVSRSFTNAEIQIGDPVIENKELAKIIRRAPTFLGLERVMRYCLLRFLHLNGIPMPSYFP
ncbi:TPA: hypothetical protein ACKQBN_004396 [Pseudomonas aeruginosa]